MLAKDMVLDYNKYVHRYTYVCYHRVSAIKSIQRIKIQTSMNINDH